MHDAETLAWTLPQSEVDARLASGADWESFKKCSSYNGDSFFPTLYGRGSEGKRQRLAEELCSGRPVISQCLEGALRQTPQLDVGLRGGMTELQRNKKRKNAPRQAS